MDVIKLDNAGYYVELYCINDDLLCCYSPFSSNDKD